MSRSSSGGIGIFGIMFWGWIIYMIFFNSDDKDDKKAEVTLNDDPSVTEILNKSISDLKDSVEDAVKIVKKDIVKSMKDVSEDVVEIKEEIKEEVSKGKEEIITPPKEIHVVAEVEPEKKEESFKPLDNKPEAKPTTMKKL